MNLSYTRLAMIVAAMVLMGACSPYVTRVDPPYTEAKLSLMQMIAKAKQLCEQRRGKENLPEMTFTTNGCSFAANNGPWRSCCVERDMIYWCGGTSAERQAIDTKTRLCILNKGYPSWSIAEYDGMRVTGHPMSISMWRWGYGHDYPHWYADEKPMKPKK